MQTRLNRLNYGFNESHSSIIETNVFFRYFPVRKIYIYKRASFIFISQKWKIRVLLGSTVPYIFYCESSGNNFLSAISDHNIPERQNYIHFLSGEPKEVVKHESGLFVSSFFKVLDVFPVTNIDLNQGS